ncbi:hypothetical protein ACVBKF_01140 [Shewanella sp. 0m-11]
MGAKFIPGKRRKRDTIRMYSLKNRASLFVDSFLEQTFAYTLELDPAVKSYATQSETLNLVIDGVKAHYTPDFLIQYYDGTDAYVEIHHSAFTDDAYEEKFECFQAYSAKVTSTPLFLVPEDEYPITLGKSLMLIVSNRCDKQLDEINIGLLPDECSFIQLYQYLSDSVENPAGLIYELIARKVYEYDPLVVLNPNALLLKAGA